MTTLTSKQRAHLRKLAHSLKPVVLVGTDGVTDAVLASILDAFNTRELLKVKLQEMFGLTDTPTVCGGQIPVTLHLLSPAQRPVQVTQDLRGFWEHTYHEVRKELKGRYPKHYWPEDPWTAEATSRLRPDQIR
jgi:HrpA-like RNA helicase